MDQRDLQKLSKDNFTTEEKEAIINNAKVNVFSKKSNIIDINESIKQMYILPDSIYKFLESTTNILLKLSSENITNTTRRISQ